MAVTDDFTTSELDLNGVLNITSPTALVWGPDGRLYVTQQTGEIFVLNIAFGDKNPNDNDPTAGFYVTSAQTVNLVKDIPNHNDDGSDSNTNARQVTGIDVTRQFDANGNPVTINGKPAVVMYVTSSDSRIGAGESGADIGLDTNSGVITRLTQTASGWDAVDIVRGLPRSEENHATNGLEVIQTIDPNTGKLLSERMIVASGGNANSGAPSNNFAGQQETPLSGALLEIDLDEIRAIEAADGVKIDDGRVYVYDLPTLNDPTRGGAENGQEPFGGNDGLNSAKLLDDGPVQIYSSGYRNPYDVEVTEDGRVFTYDNGANNVWGGRPAGEDQNGDNLSFNDGPGTPNGYIATNLFVEDNFEQFPGGTLNFNPQNWDQLHEATRSDDLAGRVLSAGLGGAQTYQWDHPDFAQPLTLVYGGHPNPTRAEGARAGLLYTPEGGVGNAKLMVSNEAKPGGSSDFLEVVAWLKTVGYSDAFINSTVVAVDPGVLYADTFKNGFGGSGANGRPTTTGVYSLVENTNGPIGIPADINDIVETLNPIEGNYLEAGFTDGALDTGKGSINGLAEYTSSIFDDAGQGGMQGALLAAVLNQTQLLVIGRNANGVVQTTTTTEGNGGGSTNAGNTPRTVAADKEFLQSGGAPLGIATLGDDLSQLGNQTAFRGTIWAGIFKQNGPVIEIYQPGNPNSNPLLGLQNYAGQEASDITDNDLDGVDFINDPFDFDADNGITIGAGDEVRLTFAQTDLALFPEFSGTIGDTGLMGAALDGVTPNRDAKTAADGFPANEQEDGLFDNGGNLIPGGNAPIFQIKSVQNGTAKGAANTLRDGVHTGIKLENDVQTLVAETDIANWWKTQPGGGRISGLSLSDGTQENFVRFVFGDIGGGQLGLEVGLEINDSYTVLGTITDPAFTSALTTGDPTGDKRITLQLQIDDIGGDYTIIANYKIKGDATFKSVQLNGATLPNGVLQDVLDGTHTISDGDTTLPSGVAIGFVAEKNNGVLFESVDYDELRINALGDPNATETILYRVNAGNQTIAAIDGGPNWQSDAAFENGTGPVFISGTDGNINSNVLTDAQNEVEFDNSPFSADSSVAPWQLFVEERSKNGDLAYNFEVETGKTYKITVFYSENFNNIFTSNPRIFDIAVEGAVPSAFNDIHPLREATNAVDGIGAPLPTFTNGTQPEKGEYLGRASARDFTYTATDNLLTLTFQKSADSGVQNPKVNAIQISEIGGTGTGPDVIAPIVTNIVVEDSTSDQDSPRLVTVTVTDETDFDLEDFNSLDGSELSFSGLTPAAVSAPQVSLSANQKTATLVYTIDPPATSGAWPQGTFGVTLAAGNVFDSAGNAAGTASFNFTFGGGSQPGAVILAVNAGGIAVDGAAYGLPGVTFEADTKANPHPTVDFSQTTTGNPANLGNNTNNAGADEVFTGANLPDDVFTSERFGNDFSYNVDVPNGTYLVDIYLAETFAGVGNSNGVGFRVFDVSVEGTPVLDDYDLFDDGDGVLGNNVGAPLVKIVKTIEATVTDGVLDLRLDTINEGGEIVANSAKISAFVIREATASTPVTASISGATNVSEAAGTATYTITINEAPSANTAVNVNLLSLGADVPGDVSFAGGNTTTTLTFTPGGPLSQTVTVNLLNDTLPELAENFAVSISGVSTTPGGASLVTTTIAANDGAVDSVNGVAAAAGDFADSGLTPTNLGTLAFGDTLIVASQQGDSEPGGRERDYFTFTVAEGQVLQGIILEDWQTSEIGVPQAFIGIQQGGQVTVDPTTFANVGNLLGGHVYNGGDVLNPATGQDGNLLSSDALGKGSEIGPGGTFVFGDGSGFTGPLPAGTYTIWLNQGGDISTATLRLVTDIATSSEIVRIQAEDFDSSNTYAVENVAVADEGAVAALPNFGFSGTATYDLDGLVEPGLYSVRIVYFDENDGESLLGITITSDGEATVSKGFRLDEATPAPNASLSALRSKTFVNVEIGENGQLVLNGTTIGSEFARVDYFEFIKQDGPVTPTNSAPYAPLPIEDQTATENSAFSLNLNNLFDDNEDSNLTFTATSNLPRGELPPGLSLVNGVLSGTPTVNGAFDITVIANDGALNSKPVTFSLNVAKDANPLEIEAEDFSGLATALSYFVEPIEGASDGDVIQMTKQTLGVVTHDLDAFPTGIYKIAVTFVDETDGVSTGRVLVDGIEVGTWVFDGTAGEQTNPGRMTGSSTELGNYRTVTLDANFAINPDSVLTLEVNTGGSETGRIDFVTLIPMSNDAPSTGTALQDQDAVAGAAFSYELPANAFTDPDLVNGDTLTYSATLQGGGALPVWLSIDPETGTLSGVPIKDETFNVVVTATDIGGLSATAAPFNVDVALPDPGDTVLIEAENFTGLPTATNYFVEDVETASDGEVIRGKKNATNTISHDLSPFEGGTYTVAVSFVDETDGVSSGRVLVDGVEIGTWVFDGTAGTQNTPGAAAGVSVQAGNFRTVTFDTKVSITPTSVLTVQTTAGGSEIGRIDSVTLTPAENNPPELGTALSDQESTVGQPFAYALPANAFIDPGDTLTYSAKLQGGADLPAWLSIDAATGTLSGTPIANGDVSVVITATDKAGLSVSAPAITIDMNLPGLDDAVLIEAENFTGLTSATSYFVEQVANASEGELVRMQKDASGAISHDLSPLSGRTYTVSVTFVDETDGVSTGRVLVDGNEVGTWVFDGTAGTKDNPTAPTGVSTQLGNYRTVEFTTAFFVGANSTLTIETDTGGSENGRIDHITLLPAAPLPGNQAPSAVSITPTTVDLLEGTDTSAAIKMGDITITDDGLGTNVLTLSGADAASFEIINDGLFLKAGAALDFENKSSFDVTILVDDSSVGSGPFDASTAFTLDVLDVNEAPELTLTPLLSSLSEATDTSSPIAVAGISVDDDALGSYVLKLSGADSSLFEVATNQTTGAMTLQLKQGVTLDAETNSALDVTVSVDDATIGTNVDEDSAALSISVTGDTPTTDVLLRINAFGPAITAASGPNWLEDTTANKISYFTGPQNRGDTDPTPATPGLANVPDAIFATARSDNAPFSYNIPISDLPGVSLGDNVTVRLYFAEASDNANLQSPTSRIFDVQMEGALALDNFSPIASFGSGSGGVVSTVVKITDGVLNLDFINNGTRNAIVNGIEILAGGNNPINDGAAPTDPTDALEILGVADGTFDGFVQGVAVDSVNNGGGEGKVVLTILDNNDAVDASNFKQDAFTLQNTGTKEIAAVFIDIRGAVFKDHVFDNDGTGGDKTAKPFQVQTDEDTGAYFVGANEVPGNNDDNLFFAGPTPLADTSGGSGGAAISGGYRGLLIRFDGTSGGFDGGESVGFSGDGDPNSIAGFSSALLKPNNVTSGDFDTGGQSGAELIGSSFTVLFADGTTATGYLGSNTTQAGAVGEAVQGRVDRTATLSVDTGSGVFDSGDSGTYGGDVPVITVSGTAGDVVRVTLIKGVRDTNAEAGGSPDLVAEVIQNRLDISHPEFPVNNAFDVQTVDVTIGANGTATVPANAFDFVDTTSGVTFNGDDIQPIALTASVITPVSASGAITGSGRNDFVPAGPISDPIYLTNPTGTPVDDGGNPPPPPTDGYFQIIGTGANQYFKIQMEDPGGTGGQDPGGKWQFVDAVDSEGRQAGFQGDGYYIFGDPAEKQIDNNIVVTELLEYTIFVPEDALGVYSFSFRVSRDGQFPNDQQNDLWLNFKHADEEGFGEIETFLTDLGANEPEPVNNGFIKIFGGPNNGLWGTTGNFDGLPNNIPAKINITEAGLYTIQIEGRSTGFHVDYFELFKGNNPGNSQPSSAFVQNGPAQSSFAPASFSTADDFVWNTVETNDLGPIEYTTLLGNGNDGTNGGDAPIVPEDDNSGFIPQLFLLGDDDSLL